MFLALSRCRMLLWTCACLFKCKMPSSVIVVTIILKYTSKHINNLFVKCKRRKAERYTCCSTVTCSNYTRAFLDLYSSFKTVNIWDLEETSCRLDYILHHKHIDAEHWDVIIPEIWHQYHWNSTVQYWFWHHGKMKLMDSYTNSCSRAQLHEIYWEWYCEKIIRRS